jgi:membrane fusion protein (multidrug efflux system)
MADDATEKPARSGRLKWVAVGAAVVIVAIVIVVLMRSGKASTDDAQVEGRITPIATRVGGTVVQVNVNDNQRVEAGFVLAQIDKRDYQVAVDRVRAELADAQANAAAAGVDVPITKISTTSEMRTAAGGVEEAKAAIVAAESQVEEARANVVASEARLREKHATATKAAKDVERFAPLVKKEEISQQQYDAAVAAAESARATADAATSDIAAAKTAVAVAEQRAIQARGAQMRADAALQGSRTAPEQIQATKAKADAAAARVKHAEAALAQALLDLERTTVKAPTAGIVSRKAVEVGQIVQPGQPLMALVAPSDVWVIANYKETQLANVRAGQRAVVEVDALGGREFRGHVDSIAAATGAKFSVLPPENATGNYVKVVQRVPVKIVLEPSQDPEGLLRPGMSVVPTIYTK